MQSIVQHALNIVNMVDLLTARDNTRLVYLLGAHLLLLLLNLDGNSDSWYWLVELLGDFLSLFLVDLPLQLLEHLVLFDLVVLIICDLVHNVVGLGHLRLNFLLVEHDILHLIVNIAGLLHEIVGLSHHVRHVNVDRCHFQLVLLLHKNCPSSSEDLS